MHRRKEPRKAEGERKEFLRFLKSRECKLSSLNEQHWTIIGNGSIGDKAEQLMKKAWAIERAGFVLTPRVVLAMDFFEGFKKRGKFILEEYNIIKNIVLRFAGNPIAVRSSAYGDSRGTGIYESVFCANNRSNYQNTVGLSNAIKEVLRSEFSKDAVAFRENANLSEGMAVIVEPVFGQQVKDLHTEEPYYGPLYGGIAYTSTSHGKGYFLYTSGLPTQAVNGQGLRIEEVEAVDIEERLTDTMWKMANVVHFPRSTNWLHGDWIDIGVNSNSAASVYSTRTIPSYFSTENFNSAEIFQKLKALEKAIGRPQYVEWAINNLDEKPEIGILQIADVNLKTDFYEFPDTRRTVIRSGYVVGSGERICNGIVEVVNIDDLYALSNYNEENSDYLVMYGGRLVSIMLRSPLRYHHISNSAVVVERFEIQHARNPEWHFGGALEESGKIYLLTNDISWETLEPFEKAMEKGISAYFYPVKVKVTASERQQKAVVELIE